VPCSGRDAQRLVVIPVVIALGASFSQCSSASPQGVTIRGHIALGGRVPEDLEPNAAGLDVTAASEAGGAVDHTRVDANGNFVFELSPGSYSLTLVKPQCSIRVTAKPREVSHVTLNCFFH
jgi:hypothetical protein